jgi:Family of unknown function (DUF5989)
MSIFAELFEFLGTRKKFWLIPLLVLFLVFGGLFVLAQGSVVAPFIYTLF